MQRLLVQDLENHHLERAGKEVLAVARFRAHGASVAMLL
jgi:hypothetical protein